MKKRSLIELGYLGELIYKIEGVFKEEGLTQDEQILVLSHLLQRIQDRNQQTKMKDAIFNIPFNKLMKKFMRDGGMEDE